MKRIIAATAIAALWAGQALAVEIAWVHQQTASQSEQRVKAGFEAWLAKTGADWNVSYLDSGGAAERIASNMQDAATRDVDAIIVTMADLRASRTAIDAAVSQGIPIFTVDSGYVDGVQVDITTNNWAMSADVSPFLLDQMGGEGNIIFLRLVEHHGTRKRGDVMEDVLQEYKDIKVLAEHNIEITAFFEDTTSTMQDMVAQFGEDIDAVWAPWDEPAQAAINVLRAAGLTDVKVSGIDGHPNALAEICKADGMMVATVSQPFEAMGAQVGEYIQSIVVGGEPRDAVIPSDIVYMPAPLVTKQNCAEFQ